MSNKIIFKCLAGSRAYGTNIETSDTDTRGCFIAPPNKILSCFESIEQIEDKKNDEVLYELGKFIKLSAENNPNLIELLFTPKENILFIDQAFQKLIDNSHLFLSKKCMHTFSGYAWSQMRRLKSHCKWINNPKDEKRPEIADFCKFIGLDGVVIKDRNELEKMGQNSFLVETFGSTQFRVFQSNEFFKEKLGFFSKDQINLKYVDIKNEILANKANFIGFFWCNIEEFEKQTTEWNQYWNWKNNRNKVRAELEEKMNFDGKHALHLMRLLKMCKEILSTGEILVKRPDRDFLLDIRNGQYTYDEVLKMAEDLENECKELYNTTSLPYGPNYQEIDKLYREILFGYWKSENMI